MSTEKRLFIFLVLSLLILLSFQRLYHKDEAKAPVKQTQLLERQEVIDDSPSYTPSPALGDLAVETTPYETQDYILNISLRGGFIKSVIGKKYNEPIPYQDLLVLPEYLDKKFELKTSSHGIRLVLSEASGEVVKEINFVDQYLWEVKVTAPKPISLLSLFSREKEEDRFYGRYQEIFYKQEEVIRLSWNKLKEREVLSSATLAGARDRYYIVSLFNFDPARLILERDGQKFTLSTQSFSPSSKFQANLYLGPQEIELLESYGIQEVRHFGFFHAIAITIIKVLHFFFGLVKNWGLSIILFSILVYILFFPLTFRSSKAMKEMRQFQVLHKGELEKLKEKYKDQPQKMHQATMELYKKYGFNPLKGCSSGCLPLFFQIPIIWAFWSVIPRALEFKGAGFLWIKDLSSADHLLRLPFTLPMLGDWLNILPLLTSAVMYVQMKFSNPEIDPSQAQQQKIMGTIFPVMMAVFFYKLPSALLLYWFTNSVLTSISQWRIMKMKQS
jgi:YidC/Oxa1 family membrane protein insertase